MSLSKLVTIVIPFKNEEKYIGNLLDDLALQHGIEDVSIYLADGNSTDRSIEVINSKKNYFTNLQIIQGGSVSEGRNNGARLATTPFICFIDADVKLYSKDTLLMAYMKASKFNLITCKLRCYSGNLLTKVGFRVFNIVHSILSKRYPFAVGTFFFVNSEMFKKYGMFNVNNDTSEDFLFSQNFKPSEFAILKTYVGQDDRRIEKMGYFGMVKYLTYNFYKFLKNDLNHFNIKTKYWD